MRLRLVCLLLALGVATAAAEPVDPAEQAALRAVVSQQIDAFNREDGAAAIAFAAPAIKDKFTDATTFLDMVHKGYAPLLHARSVDFGTVTETSAGPAQAVAIVAADGMLWRGLYTFEKVDGAWRISGCVLAQDASTPI
jgi:hypothetical protein